MTRRFQRCITAGLLTLSLAAPGATLGPMDVAVLLGSAYYMEAKEQTKKLFDGQGVGFVFDGDNFEPNEAPFSALIAKLLEKNHPVLAVKDKYDFSDSFVNDWMEIANKAGHNFAFAYVENLTKEDLSVAADAFLFYGTTYISKSKDYRFRYNKQGQLTDEPTQGYSEVLALMKRGDEFDVLRDGTFRAPNGQTRPGHPIFAVRRKAA